MASRSLGNKILRRVRRVQAIQAYRKQLTVLPYPPLELWIEPTNVCNLACVMCPNNVQEKDDPSYMSFDLFRKVADECAPFQPLINLHLGGESTMHPDCMKMARYAADKGCVVNMATNATMLTRDLSHELINSGIDMIVFSFDGYDKESYESVRLGADFEKVLGNIREFMAVKRKLGAKKPYTTFGSLILRADQSNEEERARYDAFHAELKVLGIDEFYIGEAQPGSALFSDETKHKIRAGGAGYIPCPKIWFSMAVSATGKGVPCCADFYADYPMGHIEERTIPEIWNGPEMVELRRKMIERDIADVMPCAGGCDVVFPPEDTYYFGLPGDLVPGSLKKLSRLVGMYR